MTTPSPILEQRTQSGFPLSIGTALALESVFSPVQPVYDETRIVPEKIKESDYNLYLINAATLVRNVLGAVGSKDYLLIRPQQVLHTVLEEIDYLQTFFQMHERRLQLYVHTYDFPRKHYDKQLRRASTDQQHLMQSFLDTCLSHLRKQDDVLHFTNTLRTAKSDQALVLTHVPWDLLSYANFTRLDLLESHTGKVKSRKDWNSKYYPLGKEDMSFLPFMELLLTTFGDRVMFSPKSVKDRKDLYDAMLKKKVHPLMSEMSAAFIRS